MTQTKGRLEADFWLRHHEGGDGADRAGGTRERGLGLAGDGLRSRVRLRRLRGL